MILICGGAGYVGSHANKLLHAHGYETVVFDNLSRGRRDLARWGHFVLGDLGNRDELYRCCTRFPITAVMHFAALAYVGESLLQPADYYRVNVANTLTLLDVMRDCDIRQLVFSSTCATYGIPLEMPIGEGHPQRPVTPYGRSKLMVEQILADYDRAYGIRSVSLRYFNAAGADPEGDIGEWHEPETHLIPAALEAADGRRECLSIHGVDYATPDGTCIRDYIHVNDLAAAHLAALEYLRRDGGTDAFNLANGTGYSVRQIIEAVEANTGAKVPVREEMRRPGDPPILVGSAVKAGRVLRWQPQWVTLADIVSTAWRWHLKRVSL